MKTSDVAATSFEEGRHITRVNLWRLFAVSVTVTWMAVPRASSGWLRLAAIALCCLLVYRGSRPALAGLGLLTVLAGTTLALTSLSGHATSLIGRIVGGSLGVLQVVAFVILARAPEVRAFMSEQLRRAF